MWSQRASEGRVSGMGKEREPVEECAAIEWTPGEAPGLFEKSHELDLRSVCLGQGRGRLRLMLAPPTDYRATQMGLMPTISRMMTKVTSWFSIVSYVGTSKEKNLEPEVRGTQSGPGVKPHALHLHEM